MIPKKPRSSMLPIKERIKPPSRLEKVLVAQKEIKKLKEQLTKEERDCLQVIQERDDMEEQVNQIAVALGLDEEARSWSNVNDVAERCLGAIEELRSSSISSKLCARHTAIFEQLAKERITMQRSAPGAALEDNYAPEDWKRLIETQLKALVSSYSTSSITERLRRVGAIVIAALESRERLGRKPVDEDEDEEGQL